MVRSQLAPRLTWAEAAAAIVGPPTPNAASMMPPPQVMALTQHQQGALQALLLKAATDPLGMEAEEAGHK